MMKDWSFRMGGNPIMTIPRIGVFRTMLLNHLYHHRGQLSVYLRLLDVPVPSIYGPQRRREPLRVTGRHARPLHRTVVGARHASPPRGVVLKRGTLEVMHYRTLGRTGWKVSEISFGAWAIGSAWAAWTTPNLSLPSRRPLIAA